MKPEDSPTPLFKAVPYLMSRSREIANIGNCFWLQTLLPQPYNLYLHRYIYPYTGSGKGGGKGHGRFDQIIFTAKAKQLREAGSVTHHGFQRII